MVFYFKSFVAFFEMLSVRKGQAMMLEDETSMGQ